MAGTRTHICVFFEDGWLEAVCACGQRATSAVDEDETDRGLVLLDDGRAAGRPSSVSWLARELAASA